MFQCMAGKVSTLSTDPRSYYLLHLEFLVDGSSRKKSNDGIILLKADSQASRKNLPEFVASPFDCMIDRRLWLVAFVGNPKGQVHARIISLFFNLCDWGIQICCITLLRSVGFQV